jgi:hypothetical protein
MFGGSNTTNYVAREKCWDLRRVDLLELIFFCYFKNSFYALGEFVQPILLRWPLVEIGFHSRTAYEK